MNHERCECHECTQARFAIERAKGGLIGAFAGNTFKVQTRVEDGRTRYFDGNGKEEFLVSPTQS